MSLAIAPNLRRRRRNIVLGALTVLLHLVVLDWFSRQFGKSREDAGRRAALVAVAELVPTPQQPQERPRPLSLPQPSLPLPPLPQLPPEPVETQGADDAAPAPGATPDGAQAALADASAAGTPAPAGAAGNAPATGAPAAANPAGQGSAAPASADVQSQEAAARAAAPEPRHYKVDLPPPAEILLDVARIDANGTRWSGDASLSWSLGPTGYKLRVEAGIGVLFAHVNLLTLTSEGAVGEEGFMPALMTEKRRGRALTATHFNRKDGKLSFSASEAKYPLVWGAQDKASLPLQLTAIARGDPKQLTGNIDILVGEDRDASVFSFTVVGQEQLDTRMGKIATWHLTRPPKPGSYNSRLDLWLAPDYGWMPVQIRNLEASGAVTTQTVNKINMKNAGS